MTEPQTHKQWLSSLKVGDEVAVRFPGLKDQYSRAIVKRASPKELLVCHPDLHGYPQKYDRFTGAGKYFRMLVPITEEVEAALQRGELVVTLKNTNWHSLPTSKLSAIYDLIQQ